MEWLVPLMFMAGIALGYLMGRAKAEVEYIYVEDDGNGGMKSAPHFDPREPQPGDPLFVPTDWMVNA